MEAETSPSKTVTGIEWRRRRIARVQPAGPAPMMAILGGVDIVEEMETPMGDHREVRVGRQFGGAGSR